MSPPKNSPDQTSPELRWNGKGTHKSPRVADTDNGRYYIIQREFVVLFVPSDGMPQFCVGVNPSVETAELTANEHRQNWERYLGETQNSSTADTAPRTNKK